MVKKTQRAENPFSFTDSNKRYYTYDYYLRRTFGGKCAKIVLDGGFTCPNIDGTCGYGGCIYCSDKGSGDFAASGALSLRAQYRQIRDEMSKKWSFDKCIAYFQPHTNTYAPLAVLKTLFEEALSFPDVVGLNIATRADCLPNAVIAYLAELSERTVITVEMGLQTVHDQTAAFINRGHTYAVFEETYHRLRRLAPRVRIGVHLIFGLPYETDDMMLQTVHTVAALCPDEVKLHLLYVVAGTKMATLFENGVYLPLSLERYTDLVVQALTLLPPETVVGRLTGDGDVKTLVAPLWSRKKLCVLNEIDKKLYQRNVWQGKFVENPANT